MFVNFTAAEISADLDALIEILRTINPTLRLILTVSPVPLVATATTNHVLCASTYSKAVLRVVAEEASRKYSCITYFPAYEIVAGPQAPVEFLGADRRTVSDEAIATVMDTFFAHSEAPRGAAPLDRLDASTDARSDDLVRDHAEPDADRFQVLSRLLADAECEEAMTDRGPSC